MFEFFKALLFIACGAVPSWFGCLWWNGLSLTPWSAADSAQTAVNTAVTATQGIDANARATAEGKERVRIVYRDVAVDETCPPGRGPVSDDVAERMRVAFAAPTNSSNTNSSSLRSGSN